MVEGPVSDQLGDLRLADLTTFLAVRRSGSITAAARELGVTPSQVSKAIARLEAALGLRLVSRGTRNVVLNEAGLRILPHLEAAVARLLVVGRASAATGLVVASASYLLAAFLPAIVQGQPHLNVRGIEIPPALLRAYSTEDFFDVCLCAGGVEGLPPTWSSVHVGRLRRALFAPPEIAARLGPEPVSIDKVRSIPFVCPVYYADGHVVPGEDDCPLPRSERVVGHQALAVGLALELAARTGHLVFGPVITARPYVASGQLRQVRVDGWDVSAPLFVACNSDRVLSRVRTAVVDSVRTCLGEMDPD
jgi:DNA-binding transcriptional LysR family regulator